MPRSRRTLLASLGAGICAVGSVGVHLADRPESDPATVDSFQYDAANTGADGEVSGPEPDATDRWRADVGDTEGASPVIVDDLVICSADGNVAAFDRDDGTRQWRAELAHETGGAPAIHDGRVFVPTWNGVDGTNGIHALEVETGERLWHACAGEDVTGSPTVVDGIVYAGTDAGVTGRENGRLVALEAETGDERWEVVVDDHATTPAVADGVVYAGVDDDAYVAHEAETGEQRWRYETESRARIAPTVDDGAVYVGTQTVAERLGGDDEGTLRVLDAADGSERWRRSLGTDVRKPVAVDDERAYVRCSDADGAKLVAVDRQDGSVRWTRRRCETAPIVDDDAVYVGRWADDPLEGGEVVAFERETGTERWAFTVDVRDAGDVIYVGVRNAPVVADGVVYAQTIAGDLYALETP